jgi:hypothetical protein
MLLLNEAKRASLSNSPHHVITGIASDSAGICERILACTIPKPFSKSKKTAFAAACAGIIMLTAGFIFTKPAIHPPMDVSVYVNGNTVHMGFEEYIFPGPDGVAFDQIGLYTHALSAGLKPEQYLTVEIVTGERPTLTSVSAMTLSITFQINELMIKEMHISFYEDGYSLWQSINSHLWR